jgi:hypothetical protein
MSVSQICPTQDQGESVFNFYTLHRRRGWGLRKGKFLKNGQCPGTDVMILKIFSTKNLAKILAFFAQTTASFCKNLVLEKNANFFAENWQKSQKIVIMTSTPGKDA